MKKEAVPDFGEDPEKLFIEVWKKKAEKWTQKIRLANFPTELESKLTLFIDKEFLDNYVNATVRDPKMLEIFITSCYTAIQESGEDQGKSKFDIFNMFKEDLRNLEGTTDLMWGN